MLRKHDRKLLVFGYVRTYCKFLHCVEKVWIKKIIKYSKYNEKFNGTNVKGIGINKCGTIIEKKYEHNKYDSKISLCFGTIPIKQCGQYKWKIEILHNISNSCFGIVNNNLNNKLWKENECNDDVAYLWYPTKGQIYHYDEQNEYDQFNIKYGKKIKMRNKDQITIILSVTDKIGKIAFIYNEKNFGYANYEIDLLFNTWYLCVGLHKTFEKYCLKYFEFE